jgi:propanol-preferring alcohol dehydrogenase
LYNLAVVESMRVMTLPAAGAKLELAHLTVPEPGPGELLVKVETCAVCRTDLHIVDGELTEPKLPLVPGHQVCGRVARLGEGVSGCRVGDRVGVPWLGWTCGVCRHCSSGSENLCDEARFTGYHRDGGFAEYAVADARFCFAIPSEYPAVQAAPLLCGGLIGYRALRMAGEARRIGFYGFGSAAHMLAQVVRYQGGSVYAFTRPGDAESQQFALELGAAWAGSVEESPPSRLDAAIIFAPAGELVPAALAELEKGGTVVCAGIHMSDIPSFPYSLLWGERTVRSVANLTRRDGEEFLDLAVRAGVRTHVQVYALEDANGALDDLRDGRVTGSAVLVVEES